MSAAPRVRGPVRAAAQAGAERGTAIRPGAVVTLKRPWRLRGRTAIVRRAVRGGWEVEIRTPLGTPLHLVVRARAMRRS